MNLSLHCSTCKNTFRLSNYNPARIMVSCPVCGQRHHLAAVARHSWGRIAGDNVSQILASLDRQGSKKSADLRAGIVLAAKAIERVVAEHGEWLKQAKPFGK